MFGVCFPGRGTTHTQTHRGRSLAESLFRLQVNANYDQVKTLMTREWEICLLSDGYIKGFGYAYAVGGPAPAGTDCTIKCPAARKPSSSPLLSPLLFG